MVYFTCQYCNASLKKKAVESHRFQCRRDYHLTCVDCHQDFFGNEYVKHISCLTEEQKYGGKNFTPSSAAGKQVAWVSAINAALKSDVPFNVKEVLEAAASNPNVPRNRKKFNNYFQNMGPFKFNKFVNQAFDAAEAEFKKFESKNKSPTGSPAQKTDSPKHNNEEAQKKKDKKRKTISETQEDIENVPERANVMETKNKKKKKNRDCANGETLNREATENGERKSKKKKKKSVSLEEEQDEEECEGQKKNKKDKDCSHQADSTNDLDDSLPVFDGTEETQETPMATLSDELAKLSKKERKKYLKQLKYEAEINSIENYDREAEEAAEEAVEKKKKKKDKTVNGEIDAPRESKNSISEPDGKRPKLEEEEAEEVEEPPPKPKKFRWDRLIIQVLRNTPDQEMSLKRLSRKVCGEYQLIYGDKESYDDILLMFNKKVMKTHGVRVFKDKAKIVSG